MLQINPGNRTEGQRPGKKSLASILVHLFAVPGLGQFTGHSFLENCAILLAIQNTFLCLPDDAIDQRSPRSVFCSI